MMKKYYFLAAAAISVLCGCSSSDDASSTALVDSANAPMPIKIGVGPVHVNVTRGTGTVGGFTDDADNVWHSQLFKVYMFHKGTLTLAQDDATGEDIYDNLDFQAPGVTDGIFTGVSSSLSGNVTEGIARPVDDIVKYYPSQGNYDFYAYRLDDAKVEEVKTDDEAMTIDFEINGTQDVMVAKAVPSASDTLTLGEENVDRAYSAYSARKSIQPTLAFSHKLSRLTFAVKPCAEPTVDAERGVTVDSILVSSHAKGTLTIASVNDVKGETQKIAWDETAPKQSFSLKQRPATVESGEIENAKLEDLSPVSLRGKNVNESVSIGEALLVSPDTEYDVVIWLSQPTQSTYSGGAPSESPRRYRYATKLRLGEGVSFREGYSYNIEISIWGLEEIVLKASLSKWNDYGTPIPLTPEEDVE